MVSKMGEKTDFIGCSCSVVYFDYLLKQNNLIKENHYVLELFTTLFMNVKI